MSKLEWIIAVAIVIILGVIAESFVRADEPAPSQIYTCYGVSSGVLMVLQWREAGVSKEEVVKGLRDDLDAYHLKVATWMIDFAYSWKGGDAIDGMIAAKKECETSGINQP